jgi:hypothetical protein
MQYDGSLILGSSNTLILDYMYLVHMMLRPCSELSTVVEMPFRPLGKPTIENTVWNILAFFEALK